MEYTYNDVLRLNDGEREPIRQARENAFENYSARLFKYVAKKKANASQVVLNKIIEGIKKEAHIRLYGRKCNVTTKSISWIWWSPNLKDYLMMHPKL